MREIKITPNETLREHFEKVESSRKEKEEIRKEQEFLMKSFHDKSCDSYL